MVARHHHSVGQAWETATLMFHQGRGILPRFPAWVSVRYLPYTRWLPAGRLWRRDLPWDGQYRSNETIPGSPVAACSQPQSCLPSESPSSGEVHAGRSARGFRKGGSEMTNWIDVSVTTRYGRPRWPDNLLVILERFLDLGRGNDCDMWHLAAGVPSGMHTDGPAHFIHEAAGLDEMSLAPTIIEGLAALPGGQRKLRADLPSGRGAWLGRTPDRTMLRPVGEPGPGRTVSAGVAQ